MNAGYSTFCGFGFLNRNYVVMKHRKYAAGANSVPLSLSLQCRPLLSHQQVSTLSLFFLWFFGGFFYEYTELYMSTSLVKHSV